jgi:hypothetical protein
MPQQGRMLQPRKTTTTDKDNGRMMMIGCMLMSIAPA